MKTLPAIVYDIIAHRPRVTVALAMLLAGIASLGLRDARLDMSFRPLFADSPVDAAATRAFERDFGQSAAWIGAILEPASGDPLEQGFAGRLVAASRRIEALPWITQVQSLATHPAARDRLLSRDGRRTLLLAHVYAPLDDLETRRAAIEGMERALDASLGDDRFRMVGVSVVESGYARIVLASLARSFALTTVALMVVLLLLYRRPGPVLVTMAGVSLATPASLGLATRMGQDLTMVNSIVPIMIMIIGVADAVHMRASFARRGADAAEPVRAMWLDMVWPCFLTMATTVAGFLSLGVAEIEAIRHFGVNVALGVALAWVLNLVLVPALLLLVPATRVVREPSGPARWIEATAVLVARRPVVVIVAFLTFTAAGAAGIARLETNQRFNEEVSATHPLRADQALLEREFTGFLGPEIMLHRSDGRALSQNDAAALGAFAQAVAALPAVQRVDGPLPSADGRSAALFVRTGDIGTRGAGELVDTIRATARHTLGAAHEASVVGQWWLAQLGMRHIIRDTTASFLMSCLTVLPLMALALRSVRLFLVSLLPNLLPMTFALGFMGWAGIPLRIGTAMVLAVALGIAVDDTIHMLVRLKRDGNVHAALREVARPMVYTTLALVAGFLSMLSNELLAIRDMGIVGAVTLGYALAADLLLSPAVYVIAGRRLRQASPLQGPARGVSLSTGRVEVEPA